MYRLTSVSMREADRLDLSSQSAVSRGWSFTRAVWILGCWKIHVQDGNGGN